MRSVLQVQNHHASPHFVRKASSGAETRLSVEELIRRRKRSRW